MAYENECWCITGASSGIGAALARELGARGARVILSGRDEDRLAGVASEIATETLILPFDVRDHDAMLQATGKAGEWAAGSATDSPGGIDGFVANAGVSQRSRAAKTDMQVYRDIIDIDLTSQIAATQALLPHMTQRKSGRLLFISSIAGKVGVPMRTAYCAAKFGLAGYADALRAELSQDGIDVHVIYPGSVATDVSRNALKGDGAKREKSDKVIDNGIPADEAAATMLDAVALNQREIIVARGMEEAMGELPHARPAVRQVAGMVADGYMEKMEASE